MFDDLVRFSDWLGATPLSAFAARVAWVVPTVQTVHILAIAVVVVAVAMVNLRVLGVVDRQLPVATLTKRFLPPLAIAVVVLLLSGIVMIASEPHRALFRTVFWVKMLLIVVGMIATFGVAAVARGQGEVGSSAPASVPSMTWAPRVLAGLVLLLWLAIIWSGRWIAYALPWVGAPG